MIDHVDKSLNYSPIVGILSKQHDNSRYLLLVMS
jgi:hypothetical protein